MKLFLRWLRSGTFFMFSCENQQIGYGRRWTICPTPMTYIYIYNDTYNPMIPWFLPLTKRRSHWTKQHQLHISNSSTQSQRGSPVSACDNCPSGEDDCHAASDQGAERMGVAKRSTNQCRSRERRCINCIIVINKRTTLYINWPALLLRCFFLT